MEGNHMTTGLNPIQKIIIEENPKITDLSSQNEFTSLWEQLKSSFETEARLRSKQARGSPFPLKVPDVTSMEDILTIMFSQTYAPETSLEQSNEGNIRESCRKLYEMGPLHFAAHAQNIKKYAQITDKARLQFTDRINFWKRSALWNFHESISLSLGLDPDTLKEHDLRINTVIKGDITFHEESKALIEISKILPLFKEFSDRFRLAEKARFVNDLRFNNEPTNFINWLTDKAQCESPKELSHGLYISDSTYMSLASSYIQQNKALKNSFESLQKDFQTITQNRDDHKLTIQELTSENERLKSKADDPLINYSTTPLEKLKGLIREVWIPALEIPLEQRDDKYKARHKQAAIVNELTEAGISKKIAEAMFTITKPNLEG